MKFSGFLWKDKSENGVRNILEEKIIPLDRLLVETDSPFMYPNARYSKHYLVLINPINFLITEPRNYPQRLRIL